MGRGIIDYHGSKDRTTWSSRIWSFMTGVRLNCLQLFIKYERVVSLSNEGSEVHLIKVNMQIRHELPVKFLHSI